MWRFHLFTTVSKYFTCCYFYVFYFDEKKFTLWYTGHETSTGSSIVDFCNKIKTCFLCLSSCFRFWSHLHYNYICVYDLNRSCWVLFLLAVVNMLVFGDLSGN